MASYGHEVAHNRGQRGAGLPLDLGVVWTDGGPIPILFQEGGTAFLAFRLAPIDPSDDDVGIIEWIHCSATCFGYPNDEAMAGHRLYGRGLSEIYYAGAEVLNSAWIAEMEVANRVHERHDPARFAALRHFVLQFQDDTFECVAEGFRVETTTGPLDAVVTQLVARLFGRYGQQVVDVT